MKELCERCKKNKATITFAESVLNYAHGFYEDICQECFDKEQKKSPLYKKAYKQGQKDQLLECADLHQSIMEKERKKVEKLRKVLIRRMCRPNKPVNTFENAREMEEIIKEEFEELSESTGKENKNG